MESRSHINKLPDKPPLETAVVPKETDFALAQKAAKGDTDALQKIYERHNRRVYSLCLRMMKDPTEAEDLAQEVFIQLFRKIGSFRGESAFTTWLHRMTVNQVLMHYRKNIVKKEQTTEEGETPVQIVKGTENPNNMPVLDRIALDAAIRQLPDGYRAVFLLHDVEGHEHEEIARMLGITVGTSKSQLHKARKKLRTLLKYSDRSREYIPNAFSKTLKLLSSTDIDTIVKETKLPQSEAGVLYAYIRQFRKTGEEPDATKLADIVKISKNSVVSYLSNAKVKFLKTAKPYLRHLKPVSETGADK